MKVVSVELVELAVINVFTGYTDLFFFTNLFLSKHNIFQHCPQIYLDGI